MEIFSHYTLLKRAGQGVKYFTPMLGWVHGTVYILQIYCGWAIIDYLLKYSRVWNCSEGEGGDLTFSFFFHAFLSILAFFPENVQMPF